LEITNAPPAFTSDIYVSQAGPLTGIDTGVETITLPSPNFTEVFEGVPLYSVTPSNVYIYTNITDPNGCGDITASETGNVEMVLCYDGSDSCIAECLLQQGGTETCYYASVTNATCEFDNGTYAYTNGSTVDTCSGGTDTTVNVSCTFEVDNTLMPNLGFDGWYAGARVTDGLSEQALSDPYASNILVDSVLAADFCPTNPLGDSVIDYGVLGLGEDYAAINGQGYECPVACLGNIACDAQALADDMVCDLGIIPDDSQAVDLVDSAVHGDYDFTLSSLGYVDLELDIVRPSSFGDPAPGQVTYDNIYFSVAVPSSGASGVCQGSNILAAFDDSVPF
jgi:hypothetical protein